jgi:hypothetical protein
MTEQSASILLSTEHKGARDGSRSGSFAIGIPSGSFRASTSRTYANIVEKELRLCGGDRPIASCDPRGDHRLPRGTGLA